MKYVKRIADGYRGDMSCLAPKKPYRCGEGKSIEDGYVSEVVGPDGVVGVIQTTYGSGGRGKPAAARFYFGRRLSYYGY